MNFIRIMLTAILVCVCCIAHAGNASKTYPILAIPKSSGEESLLNYELTPEERRLFKEMDLQTARVPHLAPVTEYRSIAADVGRRFGLSPEESFAFFLRTTFSVFEP